MRACRSGIDDAIDTLHRNPGCLTRGLATASMSHLNAHRSPLGPHRAGDGTVRTRAAPYSHPRRRPVVPRDVLAACRTGTGDARTDPEPALGRHRDGRGRFGRGGAGDAEASHQVRERVGGAP